MLSGSTQTYFFLIILVIFPVIRHQNFLASFFTLSPNFNFRKKFLNRINQTNDKAYNAILFPVISPLINATTSPTLPRKQWSLQGGRYATNGEKPLRATICFFDRAAVQRYGRIN